MGEGPQNNTMKNTAAGVRPIGVQGAIACPREWRRRRAPSISTTEPPHPVRDKKCHTSCGHSARGGGFPNYYRI